MEKIIYSTTNNKIVQEENIEKESVNWYKNVKVLSDILRDQNSMAVFLDIACNSKRDYSQLASDLNLDFSIIAPVVKHLEDAKLIERNPNPLSQKFKLSVTGILLLRQLKNLIPDLSAILTKACKENTCETKII